MDTDRLSALIGAVYDAAVDGTDWTAWTGVLTELGASLHSPKVVLESVDAGSYATVANLVPGWDPAVVTDYLCDYARDDPLIHDASRYPLGSVYTDQMLPDYTVYRHSVVYNDIAVPNEVQHCIGSILLRDAGRSLVLAFRRGPAAGPYTAQEQQIFGAVLPHVMRSFQLRRRLAGAQLARQGLVEAMARLGHAALLVSADARVVEMNEPARALLAAADGLRVRHGALTIAAPAARAAFVHLIAATARPGEIPPATAVASIPRPSGRRSYTVLVTQVPARHHWLTADGGIALVFVHDPESIPQPGAEVLRALYGLTAAEARLAEAIASGHTVKAYAESAGITENTARWTLKQVLAKTGTHGQAEFVRLVLSSPAARSGAPDG
jgi:DNA-binding CsgD family transcriptional regulator